MLNNPVTATGSFAHLKGNCCDRQRINRSFVGFV